MMKRKLTLALIILLSLSALLLVLFACNDVVPEDAGGTITQSALYTLEVAEEKYLFERISDATAIYYKSAEDGSFGDKTPSLSALSSPRNTWSSTT